MTKYSIRHGLARPLLLSLAVCSLCGCSAKDELSGTSSTSEIRLGVQGVTRAVNSLSDLSAVGDNLGIYGVSASDASGAVPEGGWSSGSLVMDNVRTSGVDASSGGISWSGSYFYPVGNDRYVRFCAYHPYAAGNFAIETSSAGGAPQLRFTLSGREDLMFAGPVVGSASLRPGLLAFQHRLTQLSFCLEDAGGAFAGATLESIVFTDANASGSMELENGTLGAWSTPAEIAVPGIDAVPITGTPGAPQNVGGEVMLQPGCPSFRLRVVTSLGTFEDVEIRPTSSVDGVPETTFAAGRAYLITLTFRQKNEIALGASVVPWQMAGTGSAEIE